MKEKESDIIEWNENTKLTWDDFQGKADKKSSYKASTFSGFTVESKMINNELKMFVACQFTKSKSWVKNDSKVDELLKHEQGHFDITEWHARLLRKAFSKTTLDPYDKTLNKKIDVLFKNEFKKCQDHQKKYDKETKHGVIKEQQNKWSLLIKKEIKKLNEYQ